MPRIANRTSSFRGRSGGPARATKWVAGADPLAPIQLNAASVILAQSFTAAQLASVAQAGGTIVRTRGILWVATDQLAATEDPVGALGMMVVRESARIAGVASVPTPVTDSPDDGFFVWQPWQAGMNFLQVDATGTLITGNLWKRYDFDSKAQRKFTADDAIVVTMENSNSTDGVLFMMQFRMLLKPGVSR